MVWGEPMRLGDLPRNRKGYAEASESWAPRSSASGAFAAEASAGTAGGAPGRGEESGINPEPMEHLELLAKRRQRPATSAG